MFHKIFKYLKISVSNLIPRSRQDSLQPKRNKFVIGSEDVVRGQYYSRGMDGSGRQSRLLSRLLGKLRGESRHSALDKNFSFSSTGMSESIGCGSTNDEESGLNTSEAAGVGPGPASSATTIDDAQFAANIDLRYGGQYLTPEQLPVFCSQLHHLVEVIRNIQSYARVTGEYPSELERRLEREAREVSALASEARNALEAASRAKLQRKALRAQKVALTARLARLRDSELRELESSVRASDRKLFKSWEAVKDSSDPASFEPLIEEVRGKQAALECMMRLIETKRANISRPPTPRPLPPPLPDDEDTIQTASVRKRSETRRYSSKRKRKESSREPRSVPLSGESSRHNPQQVTLYIQSAAPLGLELPRASVRDILFFTTD
ncbi:uncharacterized protein LOC116773940 [Danaus plexippus]|uniref:uncharacterized protein LOC116773940 n=1 Tax=Danaus plexippus TaxID=13037 RepID=UPI000239B6A8|nr:uncharacterized protein LOC116773940 [Danaus plexippus]